MTQPLLENVRAWFEKADHDLATARAAKGIKVYDTALFHCQQAAASLTKYAVLPRYPEDVVEISAKAYAVAYKYAKGIYDHSLSVLPKGIRPKTTIKKSKRQKK